MKEYYKDLNIADIKGEEWRDIPGYDGIYQVSNYGRIKSVERLDSIGRLVNAKIRKQDLNQKIFSWYYCRNMFCRITGR